MRSKNLPAVPVVFQLEGFGICASNDRRRERIETAIRNQPVHVTKCPPRVARAR